MTGSVPGDGVRHRRAPWPTLHAMTWHLDAAAVSAFVGAVGGALVPGLVRRLPEPTSPDPQISVVDDQGDTVVPPPVPLTSHLASPVAPPADGEPAPGDAPGHALPGGKELYAAIAALPGLRAKAAVAGGVAAGLAGVRLGWSGSLLLVLALVPFGVALAVVDWRTRLLPTRLVAPAYVVVLALLPVAALLDSDPGRLWRAGWGWVAFGGLFLLLWLVYPAGMGYGDVRLSGVLGLVLGYVGWGALVVGVLAAFVLGGVGGLLLSALRVVDRRSYPFGPFLLLGALAGVLVGAPVADWYLSG